LIVCNEKIKNRIKSQEKSEDELKNKLNLTTKEMNSSMVRNVYDVEIEDIVYDNDSLKKYKRRNPSLKEIKKTDFEQDKSFCLIF
jgi:hypothetical protein